MGQKSLRITDLGHSDSIHININIRIPHIHGC